MRRAWLGCHTCHARRRSGCADFSGCAALRSVGAEASASCGRLRWASFAGCAALRSLGARYCKPNDRGRKKTANLASFRTHLKSTLGCLDFLISRLLKPMRAVHRWREARTPQMLVDVCGVCGSPGGAWPCVPVPPCGVVRALAFSPLTRPDYSDVTDTFALWPPLARS